VIETIRERVTVKPDGSIEIRNDKLSAGATAEVIVLVETPEADAPALASLIGKGKGCFASAAEVDAFIRKERDSRER